MISFLMNIEIRSVNSYLLNVITIKIEVVLGHFHAPSYSIMLLF